MYKALTIAGSDSGGGAGIQTDLKTFAAHGVYGASVITALTAQNTLGVHGIHAVPPDFIARQMEAVLSDIPVQAAKTGMLGEKDAILAVVRTLRRYPLPNLVVDPVMIAESGHRLLNEDALDTLRGELLPLSLVVTPNLAEAEILLDCGIDTVERMSAAAEKIYRLGPRTVLIKGGHLRGEKMVDIFFDGHNIHSFSEIKIATHHTHGTGCTYAAAITAGLAKGATILQAVSRAKKFITSAITYGQSVGSGYGPTNPMGVLYREAEEKRIFDDLRQASLVLCNAPPALQKVLSLPAAGLFACREQTVNIADVAVSPFPLTSGDAKGHTCPEPLFARPVFPAEFLAAVHIIEPRLQGLLALPFSEDLIRAAKQQAYNVAEHSGPAALLRTAPDILLLTGAGAPLLLLFAGSALEAAQKAVQTARAISLV